jgi:hypothetical protein
VPRTLRALLLAVLFVGSGLLTYQIYYWVARTSDQFQLALQLLTGLPFGLACSLRFVRPQKKWMALAVFLDCVTWVAAFRLGIAFAGNLNPYVGMSLAGLVGGLGVTLATGLGCRTLYAGRTLAGAALAGAVAGAPFGLVLDRSIHENLVLAISFPLWQAAVGLWIGVSSVPQVMRQRPISSFQSR